MRPRCLCLALLAFASSGVALAQDDAKWEAGIGLGVVTAPDYRGSDERQNFLLPLPYLIYRGDRLRVDRRGVRGEVLETSRLSFTISASLGPPADSDENEARAGMPDLNPTVEIGPSFEVLLWESAQRRRSLSLRLPLRAAIATDLEHAEYVGAVFLPHLAFAFRDLGPSGGWNLSLSAGPIFATDDNHDYYYTVRPEFATPTRPAYDPSGGYSGFSAGLTLSKRYRGYWFGAFVRYDNLSGAAFEDSPLVRTRHALLAGFGVSKIVAQSARKVPPRRGPFGEP